MFAVLLLIYMQPCNFPPLEDTSVQPLQDLNYDIHFQLLHVKVEQYQLQSVDMQY